MLADDICNLICELTHNREAFFHFDIMGFIRLGSSRSTRFSELSNIFSNIRKQGGNVYVPSYSYSYTKDEVYSIKDTPCSLGATFDFLKNEHFNLRTADPIFSYLAFSEKTKENFFIPKNYECFGESSLIANVFHNEGILISVGNRLHYSTEIHYIEKLLKVPYRFNKSFKGKTKSLNGELFDLEAIYYCRDLEFAERKKLIVSFEQLMRDMREKKIIKNIAIRDEFELEWVKLSDVFDFVSAKLKINSNYLMKAFL
ncbi:MAG: AAC(3) family N-acetyltransferase [Bacteriovorax sp.]|nr:AAC(3) family N-acetyltransferase [Bacteriovorax sp.]